MKKMKRGLAALLSTALTLTSLGAFAAPLDDYEAAMKENITSANMKMNIAVTLDELNKDLKAKLEIPDGDLSVNMDYDIAMKASEDNKVMQMAMKFITKATGVEEMPMDMYMDMDLSDAKAPKMRQIMKTPANEKYIVMDYSQMPGMEQMLSDMLSPDKLQEMTDKFTAGIPEKKPEYKDGKYTLAYTEKEIKENLKAILLAGEDMFIPIFSAIPQPIGTGLDKAPSPDISTIGGASGPTSINVTASTITDEMRTQYRAQVDKWTKLLGDVKLFAEDAITMTMTLDDQKHLKTMGFQVNLAANLYDVVTKLGPELGMTEANLADFSKDITKENSDIKATVKMDCEMSNVNGDVKVEFPTLTADNSINAADIMNNFDPEKINVFYNGIPVKFDDVEPVVENDRTLVPLRKFCNTIGISDENIDYKDGVITLKNGTTTMVLTTDSDQVVITEADGTSKNITLDVPATVKNDRTLVPLRFVSENFGCEVNYQPIEGSTGMIITIAK